MHYKGDAHDHTGNTSSIVLGRIAVNLVKTQTLGWAGLAGLLCFVQGAGVAPEPSKHKENQKQGSSAVSS